MNSGFIGASSAIALILLVFVSPIIQAALGRGALRQISRLKLFGSETISDLPQAAFYIFGLLLHLSAIFFLKNAGLPWAAAVLIPLAPIILHPGLILAEIKSVKIFESINFVLWFAVCLFIGASIFQAVDGIKTPWVNNYGDLTFHIGMITSFVLGGNFPSQYHIFPGHLLSYPVFINLWSSSLWWLAPSFRFLSFIFAAQWLFLWIAVYSLLRGDRYKLLPWALLLGGGSFAFLFRNSGGPSINENGAWSVFLTTIWIPQRSALLGAAAALAALAFFWAAWEGEGSKRRLHLFAAGLTAAVAPLAHAHICLVVSMYMGLFCLLRVFRAGLGGGWGESRSEAQDLLYLVLGFWPGIVFVPWLLGKEGAFRFILGWTTGLSDEQRRDMIFTLGKSLHIWGVQAAGWIALAAWVWFLSRSHKKFAPLLILFIFGNLFLLAEWDWDQLKVFLGLYCITLSVIAAEGRTRSVYLAHFLAVILIIPAALEVGAVLFKYDSKGLSFKAENYEVYSREKLERAAKIVELTKPTDIIAGGPDHNSLVTLTGRKLFYGYEGTLSSHGLKYNGRREMMGSLEKLFHCAEADEPETPRESCPQYLLWTDDERRYFAERDKQAGRPPTNYTNPPTEYSRTSLDFLYSFNGEGRLGLDGH